MQSYFSQYSASPCLPFAAYHLHSVSAAMSEPKAPIGPLRVVTHLNPQHSAQQLQTTTHRYRRYLLPTLKLLPLFVQMGEYEYHANPLDWHKASNKDKSKKGTESGVFRPPTVGRVGTLFNKIEVSCCRMESGMQPSNCCGWCLQFVCKLVAVASRRIWMVCGCSNVKACVNSMWPVLLTKACQGHISSSLWLPGITCSA